MLDVFVDDTVDSSPLERNRQNAIRALLVALEDTTDRMDLCMNVCSLFQ